MILKDFYTQKKTRLNNELSFHSITKIDLYTDNVFRTTITEPILMFKYNNIAWQSTPERIHNGDVDFCVYLVLPKTTTDLATVFDIAHSIDKAMLYHKEADKLIADTKVYKVAEKQYTNDSDNWDKTDYFIWEMRYKTILVDTRIQKKYDLIYNGNTATDLQAMGYELTTGATGQYNALHPDKTVDGTLFLDMRNPKETTTSIFKSTDLDNDGTADATVGEQIDTIDNKVKNVGQNAIDERNIKVSNIKK